MSIFDYDIDHEYDGWRCGKIFTIYGLLEISPDIWSHGFPCDERVGSCTTCPLKDFQWD